MFSSIPVLHGDAGRFDKTGKNEEKVKNFLPENTEGRRSRRGKEEEEE